MSEVERIVEGVSRVINSIKKKEKKVRWLVLYGKILYEYKYERMAIEENGKL
jgi:hypothetical protein